MEYFLFFKNGEYWMQCMSAVFFSSEQRRYSRQCSVSGVWSSMLLRLVVTQLLSEASWTAQPALSSLSRGQKLLLLTRPHTHPIIPSPHLFCFVSKPCLLPQPFTSLVLLLSTLAAVCSGAPAVTLSFPVSLLSERAQCLYP